MRTIKEILIIVRDNLPKYMDVNIGRDCWGLCSASNFMSEDEIITEQERCLFEKYIYEHKPRNKRTKNDHSWWWCIKSIKPRINFLNKLISKL